MDHDPDFLGTIPPLGNVVQEACSTCPTQETHPRCMGQQQNEQHQRQNKR